MAVMTADRAGTPAAEAPAGDCGGKAGEHEQLWCTVLALGIAAAAFAGAWGLHGNTSSTYRIDSHWGAFTGLFILALAIERALEPFSRKLGPDTTRRKDTQHRALASAQPDDVEGIAVECQLAVDMCLRLTAVVTWGVATGLAFLLCAQLNITLMQAVRASGSGAPRSGPTWWLPALSSAQAQNRCMTSSPTLSAVSKAPPQRTVRTGPGDKTPRAELPGAVAGSFIPWTTGRSAEEAADPPITGGFAGCGGAGLSAGPARQFGRDKVARALERGTAASRSLGTARTRIRRSARTASR